jgi:hypothetical protein
MPSDYGQELLGTQLAATDVIVLLTDILIAHRSVPHYHNHTFQVRPLRPLTQFPQVGQDPAGPQLLSPVTRFLHAAVADSCIIVRPGRFIQLLDLRIQLGLVLFDRQHVIATLLHNLLGNLLLATHGIDG